MRILGIGLIGLIAAMTFVIWVQMVLFAVSILMFAAVCFGQALPVGSRKFHFSIANDNGPDRVTLHFDQARFVLMLICVSYFFFGAWMALLIPKTLTSQLDTGSTKYVVFYVYTYLSMLPAILLLQFVKERWFLVHAEATIARSSCHGTSRYYWFTIDGHEYGGSDCATFETVAPFVFYAPTNPDNCRSPYQFGFHHLNVKSEVV